MAPDAPTETTLGELSTHDNNPPHKPLTKYIIKNFVLPTNVSIWVPKIYNEYIFTNKWINEACKNMWVTKRHNSPAFINSLLFAPSNNAEPVDIEFIALMSEEKFVSKEVKNCFYVCDKIDDILFYSALQR